MAHLPVVLIIRDGWGIEPGGQLEAEHLGDAPLLAHLPFHNHLIETAPMGRLSASGEDVGLPAGQMGNSEVGHLNLGAGRIVYQNLTLIDKTIREGRLGDQPVLAQLFADAQGHRLHLIGLVSDGGVHSHQQHLVALVRAAAAAGVAEIIIHAITDGRDTSPTSGAASLQYLQDAIADSPARIFTVIGRYFAMDRDHRWERTEKAWNAIVSGQGEFTQLPPAEALNAAYASGQTDEFIEPLIFAEPNQRRISEDDAVLFFNFRSDRGRQLSEAFLADEFLLFPNQERGPRPQIHYATLTQYDANFDCGVVFPPQILSNTLGEVVAQAGLRQLRIAETEKYPHVTYFFNGGAEEPNPNEQRIIVPSPKVATYDLQPEMSCPEVTARVLAALPEVDLVILNFANPDMVGHTGSLPAAIQACETVDDAVRQVAEATLALGGSLLITADHGNCEQMKQPDGSPHTAHTTNLVQCWYLGPDQAQVKVQDGILADIAPTLLDMLGVPQPPEMTGHSLLERR